MKVKIDCTGNEKCGWATVELPTPIKKGEKGKTYLWFGAEDRFFGTIKKRADLVKLRKMIDKVLKENAR